MAPESECETDLRVLAAGIPLPPPPPPLGRDPAVPHAPVRTHRLTTDQKRLAVKNALRYFPLEYHSRLAPEFAQELDEYGHIYMYRLMPKFPVRAYPLQLLPARCPEAAAIMLMILNNLDPAVAQFPHELVTYGGNGQVFSNWAQFWLVMRYLSSLERDQTLVLYSGHPLGVFPSPASAPRLVITNGMVVPNYSTRKHYDDMFALGVTMYGQMTAGSFCYIGPQGIVHGTTITLMSAGRKYLGCDSLAGKVFVTAGLGGMSGAQAKAAVIAGCVGVIAEVSEEALQKRLRQGWLCEVEGDLNKLIQRIREARRKKEATSIGYHGNIVNLWERLVRELREKGDLLVDLGSDQTSCHNPFQGGYYPVQLDFHEAQKVLSEEPERFSSMVQASLVRHVEAVNELAAAGMRFWDYGNAFLLEARRAGADVEKAGAGPLAFRYPTYVQDIMGDIFSLGFGPFRWVCTSGLESDLQTTDKLAIDELETLLKDESVGCSTRAQYESNLEWLRRAEEHRLVVGSQARILYADREARRRIAAALNDAVRSGAVKGPIVLSRDHHDVSGTDSPFRETSNIDDGSAFCADMAVQNCIGDAIRGATWVALHNGGGVGWGEVINGGFGLLLDGSEDAAKRAHTMLAWDVSNGVARRCWSGNELALEATSVAMKSDPRLEVTLPHHASPQLLNTLFQ
ncbi:urocanate hydratase-like [Schistocerca americana]|uniref:urocanate hydratase-like n=1 Tax=Schistocerca americana TaxID=7009 RepID=UPI001F4F51D9|nr:urocanate hydratase-like [Schistocerca americana]